MKRQPWIFSLTTALAASSLFGLACSGDGVEVSDGRGEVFFSSSTQKAVHLARSGNERLVFSGTADGDPAIFWIDLASEETLFRRQVGTELPFVAADGGRIVWIAKRAGEGASLLGLDLDAGAASGDWEPTVLATGIGDPAGLAIDAHGVYFADDASDEVKGIGLEAGTLTATSEPLTLARDAGATRQLASDGAHLYFVQSWDLPAGKIRRVPLDGFPERTSTAELFADGLGTPWELTFTDGAVYWGGASPSSLQCAPKSGGAASALPIAYRLSLGGGSPTLSARGHELFYLGGSGQIGRYATDGGATSGTVAQGGPMPVSALIVIGDDLYWQEGGAIRKISASNTVAASGGGEAGQVPASCKSPYDGTYSGLFTYRSCQERCDEAASWTSRALNVELTLGCQVKTDETTMLTVTHAAVDDAYFGCQLGGCTPQTGSAANLPTNPPTNASNPSSAGQGLVVLFPNGTMLATSNLTGELIVSSNGETLSNGLGLDASWTATSLSTSGTAFPNDGAASHDFPSWILNKSAK